MEELVKNVFTAPVGTLFVLAGILFLFIAVIGKISGKIEPGLRARVLSGVLGSAFISIGLAMTWATSPHPSPGFTLPIPDEKNTNINEEPASPPPPTPPVGDNIPDWVPVFPAKVENLSVKMREGGGQYGSFFFISGQQPDAVLTFYQTTLELNRWKVTKKEGALSAANEGGSQSIAVTSGTIDLSTKWRYVVSFSEYKRR